MVGFAPVLLAAICISARNMGWLPVSFLTTHVAQMRVAYVLAPHQGANAQGLLVKLG